MKLRARHPASLWVGFVHSGRSGCSAGYRCGCRVFFRLSAQIVTASSSISNPMISRSIPGNLRQDFLESSLSRGGGIRWRADRDHRTERSAGSGTTRWNGQGEISCGPVRIRIFAFDLEGESLARIGPRTEVSAWLREWTGVSIYRDGFRVWPFGEPHDDWLRLDQGG